MGETPPETDFPSLRMDNVTPAAFASTWQESMERWGTQIKQSVEGVSEMLAVGLGLPQGTFLEAGRYGSHLLAPTATDLRKYGRVGESE
jgi:isopenicillin N synthase-like dioxygenase